ncbi:MAG TPA: TolC family protein [Steroidobacteraceae bacterium]|nr:TolC family protein [Steroidobacteraceae bacterium]
MFFRFGHTLGALALSLLSWSSQAREIRVAVITDGPTVRQALTAEVLEREIANVAAAGLQIVLPADKRIAADWSLEGAARVLDRALADPAVEVVVTLGILTSQTAARRSSLPKPVIAPLVIDPVLQGYPLVEGRSARHNFAYVADFQSVANEVRAFHDIVGFKHMVALVEDSLLAALPALSGKATELAAALNVRIDIVRVGSDVDAVLASIPAGADAVYVTPLRFNEAQGRGLARGLAQRKLPTFSVIGRSEVEAGLLMTTGGAERDTERLARRLAIMIQRIAQGEDPARFDVAFPTSQRLVINMQVAREIGFSPRWQFLADAEQLHSEPDGAQPLTLIDAMRAALDANPALAASRERLGSALDDVRIARSELLPSLSASAGRTRIDEDRATPLTQAEDTTSTGLSFSQIIYSERAWAGYSIAQSLGAAQLQSQRADMLDTLTSAAAAYLNVLRAKSVEQVRRRNAENTRRNLEISRVREEVGLAGRSDYLRWVAQLARDKQTLLAAESSRRQAETEMLRILHRPANQPFSTVESGIDDPLTLVSSPRTQAFLDTPAKWGVFMEYAVHTALGNAPEIQQADAVLVARQRALVSAGRSFYLPDLALVSNGSKFTEKSGAGSLTVPGAPDDESWSVSLQATLPLLTGGQRGAERSQARHEVRASEADKTATIDAIEARTRLVLHQTASSWPAIDLSREAQAAADENLANVTDAYARGAVSVTDLIDAQETALLNGLSATDAKYGFMTDFINVLRSMGEFEILLDPASREAWYARVETWFREHQ